VLESAGGGVVVPLLDESGGGLAGADWSAGGALCIEFEELESGAAGAVVAESEGAPGDVDCCLEQATIARALKHNKRRLRFIDHLTIYRYIVSTPWAALAIPGWTQRLDASSVPPLGSNVPVSSRLRLFNGP